MNDELVVEIPGLRIAVRAYGPKDAPPVLAFHGFLDNAATFDRLAPLLKDRRIYAVDSAGHGLSQHRSADASYDFIHTVADAHHLANALGLVDRFTIMGHSIGAATALLYAGAFPERVHSVVVLDGLGPMVDTAENAPQRLHDALLDEKRESKLRVFPSIDDAAEKTIKVAVMRPDSAKLLLARGLVAAPGGFVWRSDSRLRSASRTRLSEAQVAAFMRAISAPVFVLLASRGWPSAVPEMTETRMSYLQKKELHQVEGDHHVHLDAPETFISLLQAFLQSV